MSRRPDGLLNHNILDADKGPQDACGVFGVWAPGEEVAKLAFYGLYALQHRGQESAGIATSSASSPVLVRLPLWAKASVPYLVGRRVGCALTQVLEPVVL